MAKGFKNKRSAGIDKIPDYVVKKCIQFLKGPLANIYNASLEQGIFPDKLKLAKIIPIYKKGDTRNIQNYRPIALLSIFSKLLEKLVYNRVITFIEGMGILNEEQHGFRMNRSTETAIWNVIGDIQEAINKKVNPIGLLMDLTKAYDVLDHKLLLFKLNKYGIRGVTNSWFESYLLNRKQCVVIENRKHGYCISSTRHIKFGVPQGSILGPLLFSLYINDLPLNVSSSKLVLFADDTNVLISGENDRILQDKLTNTVYELQLWFMANNLIINTDKTSMISFHTTQARNPK